MADDGLDDFFAKKDKSKKKSKSSKVKPDDILAQTEITQKKKSKKSKKEKETNKTSSNQATVGLFHQTGEEDEWKEVEEEEKDYSGLRIANLQISEKDGENQEGEDNNEDAEELDENGEVMEKKDTGQTGPWNSSSAPQSQQRNTATPPPVEEPSKPAEESAPAKTPGGGKYVPPAARAAAAAAASGGGGAASSQATVPSHLRNRKKNAPNLTSEEDFPTLGGGTGPQMAESEGRTFEKVSSGGRQMEDPSKQGMKLSLGNKYAALQD